MSDNDEMISVTTAMKRGYASKPTLYAAIDDGRLPAERKFLGGSKRHWQYMVCVRDLEHCFGYLRHRSSGYIAAVPIPTQFERTVKRMTVEEIDAFIDILEQQKAIKLADSTGSQAQKVTQ